MILGNRFSLAIAVALLMQLSLSCRPVDAAGFDCSKAKAPTELAICNTPELSKADSEMNELYQQINAKLSKEGKRILKKEQLKFLKFMGDECVNKKYTDKNKCIIDMYNDDIKFLESIPSHPPFFVLMDGSFEKVDRNDESEQTISGRWPFIDGPDIPQVKIANAYIKSVCVPPDDEGGDAVFFNCVLGIINKKMLSITYQSGHWPTKIQVANYQADEYSILAFDGEPFTRDTLFIKDSGWDEKIRNACKEVKNKIEKYYPSYKETMHSFYDDVIDVKFWKIADNGITVECGEKAGQNLGSPRAEVPWSTLKPFMKPGALGQ
jgi:uncharacterized protein